ncbi:MAG: DNA repair protein RecN [Thiotrichales bacterium 35-46-9]|nr:MAG: DNA repair protein RecN [Thiotrichales bacterium 35-46-9]
MLLSLHIRNFVLVDEAQLNVEAGLTVLTGETGAGKSLLLDALGAVLGDKAQPFWVRPGCDKAEVSAEFNVSELPSAQHWLAEQELADDDQCLLRRVINNDGRSKAYINGTSVTLGQLRQLAEMLIELHSQHEHHALLTAQRQLALIDTWSQNHAMRKQVKQAWQAWHELYQQQQQLLTSEQQRQERLTLLRFQADELKDMNLEEGDYETLTSEHARLAHAADITQHLQQTLSLFEHDRQGILGQLNQGLRLLESIQAHDASLTPLIEQFQASMVELGDIQDQLHHRARHTLVDDHRLAELESQLSELHRLSKKYFVAADELWRKKADIMSELDQITAQDANRDSLAEACEQALTHYQQLAQQLSEQRQAAAPQLANLVMQELHQLGMTHSRLEWRFNALTQPHSHGLDQCEIVFSANPGQTLYPMSKVASGGELARISLAIEVCVAEQIALPTLIFDEVDVGVGGGIADSIGQKLAKIAQHKQVLCITHQAQVAAWGDQHWHIAKQTDGEQTLTQVKTLNPAQRVEELSRMVGTQEASQETLAHAEQMLARTARKKQSA